METNIQETNVCSKGSDVDDKLWKIDQLDQPQKFKDQLQSSNDTPTFVNVKKDRIEQNHAKLGSTNNMKYKNISDQKNKSSKIRITAYRDHFNNNNTKQDINNNSNFWW